MDGAMNCYLVYLPGGSDSLESIFDPHCYTLEENRLWAVATKEQTCADVSKLIGIGAKMSGVVVRIGEYYGHYDVALWQKLDAWSRL